MAQDPRQQQQEHLKNHIRILLTHYPERGWEDMPTTTNMPEEFLSQRVIFIPYQRFTGIQNPEEMIANLASEVVKELTPPSHHEFASGYCTVMNAANTPMRVKGDGVVLHIDEQYLTYFREEYEFGVVVENAIIEREWTKDGDFITAHYTADEMQLYNGLNAEQIAASDEKTPEAKEDYLSELLEDYFEGSHWD